MFQYIDYNCIEGLASVWGTWMASALFLYKCRREGADRPGVAQKATVRFRIQASFRDGLKDPETKTEPTRRTKVVKPFSRAESHLRGREGVCPGRAPRFAELAQEFLCRISGQFSTQKDALWNRRDPRARTVRAGL